MKERERGIVVLYVKAINTAVGFPVIGERPA